MFRLTEDKIKKFAEIEEWNDSQLKELKKDWAEDPIYVWGGKDEKEVFNSLKEKGYKWSDGLEPDKFDPGSTWGYPVVIFVENGKHISYTPVDFGRDTDEEPIL